MRAIAACQFTLSQFAVWRAFVVVLTAVVVLGLAVWAVGRPSILAGPAIAAAGGLLLVACAFGVTLARVKVAKLSWDGHRWLLAHPNRWATCHKPARWRWPSIWEAGCCCDFVPKATRAGLQEPGCRSNAEGWRRNGTPCAVLYIRRGPRLLRDAAADH